MTNEARIIHLSINRPWRDVYEFAHRPQNMQLWAAGLARGLVCDGDEWIADGGAVGDVRVRFCPANAFGVIDHWVRLADGTVVFNALRVVANGDGCEVMFTLLRQQNMNDAAFDHDANLVRRDLEKLKVLLESPVRSKKPCHPRP